MDKLKEIIEKSLDDDKASDIISVPLAGKSSLADYMIVATGLSQKHIAALADKLADKISDMGYGRVKIEGKNSTDWILLDAHDIIVHLFREEARGLYNIEKMWSMPAISLEAKS